MAGEWRETTLGEVTDFLSGGTPSKGRPDYWVGSVPWVSAKDMKRFRLDDTEDHVSGSRRSPNNAPSPTSSARWTTRSS
jgi:type I restriction enzyme S subunit